MQKSTDGSNHRYVEIVDGNEVKTGGAGRAVGPSQIGERATNSTVSNSAKSK